MSGHRIHIARDLFKFSCAHMTVFPDGRKERLHGHNYTIGISIDLSDIEMEHMLEFAIIKDATTALCREWREHTLLAENNSYMEIQRNDDRELEFVLCGDRYVLPRGDALLLPIDNVTVEHLADHVCTLLLERIPQLRENPAVTAIEVTVSESPGQSASRRRTLVS